MRAAARRVGQDKFIANASGTNDIDTAFADMLRRGAGALLVSVGAFFNAQRRQIVDLQHAIGIPLDSNRDHVATGGLTSYRPDLSDSYRQAGIYVGRTLNGEKAGDLPVL